MRAAIYNPYWDTLGGGERYSATFAQILLDKKWQVDLEWNSLDIKNQLMERFGLNLDKLNIVKDIYRGKGYDLCFWVSDGSIPLLFARRNYLHFQVPFKRSNRNKLKNRIKLLRIRKIVCNSNFTKSVIDKEYRINSCVIYPPVDTINLKPGKKDNVILSVGRFSKLKQAKGQNVLVFCFKKMCDLGLDGWKLILAGGTEVGSGGYLEGLKVESTGYPIEFVESPSFRQLLKLYSSAKMFWSASGYGVDQVKEPEKVEHFGITLVEAMSAGCLPIVYNAGGHREIINNSVNGFLWDNKDELMNISNNLIEGDNFYDFRGKLISSCKKFSMDSFNKNVEGLIK